MEIYDKDLMDKIKSSPELQEKLKRLLFGPPPPPLAGAEMTEREKEALRWADDPDGRGKDCMSCLASDKGVILAALARRLLAGCADKDEALRAVLKDPVIAGMSARIRNCARTDGRPDPRELCRAALAQEARRGE
jgi:hypothetical protein